MIIDLKEHRMIYAVAEIDGVRKELQQAISTMNDVLEGGRERQVTKDAINCLRDSAAKLGIVLTI